jgi:hypothetical protein
MLRLISADLLKLRRRGGMLAVVALIVFGAVAAYYGVGLILGNEVGGAAKFDEAMGLLVLVASVAGVVIGATAGGADSETGVWRDLVATGRSRTALFAARVPAAWAIVLAILAAAVLAAAALAALMPGPDGAPTAADVARGGAAVLVAGAFAAAVCAGLAALAGSRGMVMGIAMAFQLGVSPLLAQVDALGDARLAIPQVALTRLDGAEGLVASLPLAAAMAILLAWAAAGLGAGLWRARTQEI